MVFNHIFVYSACTPMVAAFSALKDHLHGAMHRAIDRPIDRPMHLICIHTYTIDRAICSVPLCLFRLLPQAELTGNRTMTV